MEVGAVAYKNDNLVKYAHNVTKNKDILKVLNKSKVEKEVDLAGKN